MTKDPVETLYLPVETADLLRSNIRTLERWRQEGHGPRFVRVGRRVAYPASGLREWIQARTEEPSEA